MGYNTQELLIANILKIQKHLDNDIKNLEPRDLLKLLRKKLKITQKQLAKRAKVDQSYIAKVESNQINPTYDMLKKLFAAMFCKITLTIIPDTNLDEILKKQAYLVAKKKVKYIIGTMSLEKQKPNKKVIEKMIKQEQKKLLLSKSSKIWDLDD